MSILDEAFEAARAIFSGLRTTGRHILKEPVTFQFPENPKPLAPRFKGRHILQRYENGMERCIGCSLCAAACPADAIYVEPAENNPDHPNSPGERFAAVYEINLIRCIYCGYCEEACPVDAIVLKHEYRLSQYTRDKQIIDKAILLVTPEDGFGDNPFEGGMGRGGWESIRNA